MKKNNTSVLLGEIEHIFRSKIPFNNLLGFDIDIAADDDVRVTFAVRPELIGNFTRQVLHGGVICSALDVVGGLALFVRIIDRLSTQNEQAMLDQFSRFGTSDLRVDFLRPGLGKRFIATGTVIRAGSSVGVVRMDLHNDVKDHIATATGNYSIR